MSERESFGGGGLVLSGLVMEDCVCSSATLWHFRGANTVSMYLLISAQIIQTLQRMFCELPLGLG